MPSRDHSSSPRDDRRKRRRVSPSRSPERDQRHRRHSPSRRSERESGRQDRDRAYRHSRQRDDDRQDVGRHSRRGREEDATGRQNRDGHERPDLRRRIEELGGRNGLSRDSQPAPQAEDTDGMTVPVAAPPAIEAPTRAPTKGRAGGVYVPPWKQAQLAAMLPASNEILERQTWDALRKSLNGHVNKITAQNVRAVVRELIGENIIRGKGLLCRSLMRSQMASPTFTPVYAAVAALINTLTLGSEECPGSSIIELLLHRLIQQMKRSYKRNDKAITGAALKFLAHLTNQSVLDEMLIMEVILLMLALENLTDDSVEMALGVFREVGQYLDENSPAICQEILNTFRRVLQEGTLAQRTRFLVEGMLLQARDRFKEFPIIPEGLDIVEDEQILHRMELFGNYPTHVEFDVFRHVNGWEKQDAEYKVMTKTMLGSDSDEEAGSGDQGGSDSEEEEEEDEEVQGQGGAPQGMQISDMTETNLINLRRTIYLTIMSSMSFEEAGHKLIKIELAPGQEIEVVTMLIECCSQEKTYLKYYGLVAQRFCCINREYTALFEDCFTKQYMLIHRLETNKLRNVARMFAHLLSTDAISWAILAVIRVTEDDTTSSSRIFIKILFQDLSENMGMKSLNERLQDPAAAMWFQGIFPHDTPRNIRFSINFFTSIGLGGLTDKMRADLLEMPKLIAAQQAAAKAAQGSDDSSSSSDDSSSSSSTDSSSSGSGSSSSASSSSDDESPPPKPKHRSSAREQRPSRRSTKGRPQEQNGHYPPPPPLPSANARPKLRSVVAAS
ncbi:hypothetical protein WJX74_002896 [Apatococcus lobatus]|uniref:MI domain-containing protein n=1 Tax=Apatococcus lobatus TaxID=904363 RepID=A0AAW1RL85_9CHLO